MTVLYCIRVAFYIVTLYMKLQFNKTGNVRMTQHRRVRTIVVVDKQYVLHILSVCLQP
jgi:hypothetical protein